LTRSFSGGNKLVIAGNDRDDDSDLHGNKGDVCRNQNSYDNLETQKNFWTIDYSIPG
jgi:hypothetical protein